MLKKAIVSVASLLIPFAVFAGNPLEGLWEANGSDDLALPGLMEIKAKGLITLTPQGHSALSGTWEELEDNGLMFSIPPHGSVTMSYTLEDNTLTLNHINGAVEVFTRSADSTAN